MNSLSSRHLEIGASEKSETSQSGQKDWRTRRNGQSASCTWTTRAGRGGVRWRSTSDGSLFCDPDCENVDVSIDCDLRVSRGRERARGVEPLSSLPYRGQSKEGPLRLTPWLIWEVSIPLKRLCWVEVVMYSNPPSDLVPFEMVAFPVNRSLPRSYPLKVKEEDQVKDRLDWKGKRELSSDCCSVFEKREHFFTCQVSLSLYNISLPAS